jgi:putative ABC transport system permease protein
VLSAAAASALPGIPVAPRPYRPEGLDDGGLLTNTLYTDYDYLAALEITLAAGRFFERERPADAAEAYVVNAAAVRHFGWPSNEAAVGKRLTSLAGAEEDGVVVGVVDDFHYASLHESIQPLVMRPGTAFRTMAVRIRGDRVMGAMDDIERRWEELAPGQAFNATFFDDHLRTLYRREERFGRLFAYFAGVALFIACLGLFGLAAFTAEQRTREIGIRKVMGASAPRIAVLLSRDYLGLVLVANLLAAPVAYLAMQRWLDGFAYRIEQGPGIFLLAALLALSIALLAVGYQSVRAALTDPVRALRHE